MRVIAITHKKAGFEEIGLFHIEENQQSDRLNAIKQNLRLGELMYLSTCNRVEFYFISNQHPDDEFLIDFFHAFNPGWSENQLQKAIRVSETFSGEDAIKHVFSVAASLDSMVVGEREIITQVRNAYENCQRYGITGDYLRMLIRKTVETAKSIYTNTEIATKPVSVVSLAYRKLRDLQVKENARILIVGAGQTNTTMSRFLKKNGFNNFVVFNRTIGNGLALANELKCEMRELKELAKHQNGFDIIITCTAAAEAIITPEIYRVLLNNESDKKIVIDLAVPNDLDKSIEKEHSLTVINVENLKPEAEANLREREKELDRCNKLLEESLEEFQDLLHERRVEKAMEIVPRTVKEIREQAINTVFQKEISSLNPETREMVEKLLNYMEKKYISVPMKMAKEILLEANENKESDLNRKVKNF